MLAKIRLRKNETFTAELHTAFPPPAVATPFGWVYVVGYSGNATIEIADGTPFSLPSHAIPGTSRPDARRGNT
jgi:hypothetical protein